MSAKVIWIIVASVAIVAGMFVCGKMTDKKDGE